MCNYIYVYIYIYVFILCKKHLNIYRFNDK